MKHADAFAAALMAAMGGAILLHLWRARRGRAAFIRRIAGIDAIEEAVGRATEMGRPIVFGMGWTDIRAIETHACLSILRYVAHLAARMRTPLTVLVRVANVYPVAEEVLREAYTAEGVPDLFQPDEQVRFLSEEGAVYAMGVARAVEQGRAGCGLFFGAFDYTSLLMAEPGARAGVLQIAGDPTLWQVPFFVVTCSQTVIGEEYYAAGAYLSPDPMVRGSLAAQDLIKLVLAALIVLGLVLGQFSWGADTWLYRQLVGYAR